MAIEKLMCYLIGHTTRSNKTLLSAIWEKGLVILGASSVGNQQKWDTLGPERSGVGKSLGELPEGPVWWFFESGLDPPARELNKSVFIDAHPSSRAQDTPTYGSSLG